jgi:hypothetical protein
VTNWQEIRRGRGLDRPIQGATHYGKCNKRKGAVNKLSALGRKAPGKKNEGVGGGYQSRNNEQRARFKEQQTIKFTLNWQRGQHKLGSFFTWPCLAFLGVIFQFPPLVQHLSLPPMIMLGLATADAKICDVDEGSHRQTRI